MRPAVKVCGVTDAIFAAEAARLGVDFEGVIFAARSPRRVAPAAAKEIAAAARAARKDSPPRIVGVFTREPPVEDLLRIAAETGLDVVQLHGDFDSGDAAKVKAAGFETWRLAGEGFEPGCEDAVLLDGRANGAVGGTGTLADWSLVSRFREAGKKVVLAGGISAGNAASAAATGADVLDVNSSLEISPGVKSVDKLAGFLDGLSFSENDMISKQPKTKRRMPCA